MHAGPLLETVSLAIFLGILAQVVADRLKLPAILPLLLFGMAAGPQALGLLNPADLGDGLEVFVKIGIAVILFEGGLSLDPRQLRRVGAPVRNLLTLGVVVTGVGGAWLAQVVTGMPWATAALFGAIVTVTGPTVIVPLLRHMIAPRRVRTILVSEGLIVDPIGAVLAYLVLQWIERTGQPFRALSMELLGLVATGAVLGLTGGMVARFVASSRFVGRELRNLVILALLIACFTVAEMQVPESGILASVVMGLTMSMSEIPDLEPLRSFKEQLTMLLISVLFVLLSGQLDLQAMKDLGWEGVAVTMGLILLVRPLAVLASVWPTHLDWRARTVLALTAPRGIVAAAVASLSAIQLRAVGIEGAGRLEGLVYLVILLTGTWATGMALLLPRVLGYAGDPSRRLTVLVGANPLTRALAETLDAKGRKVVVVDAVRRKMEGLTQKGILTVVGDARDASTYEEAGVERDTHVLAATANDELNLLVAELVREEFGVEHPVVTMQRPPEEFGSKRRAWVDLLTAGSLDVVKWMRWLEGDKAAVITVDLEASEDARLRVGELLRDEGSDVNFVCGWVGGDPQFRLEVEEGAAAGGGELERFAEVTLLVLKGPASQGLQKLVQEAVEVEEAPQAWEGPLPDDEDAAGEEAAAGGRSSDGAG